ncbi:MAG TPA: TSCPD domain-containing protein, partial [bacterium]|nr:TSCPD domain-containing protein [bacterium]
VLDGEKLVEFHPRFLQRAKREGFHSDALLERVAELGSVQGLKEIPRVVRRVFVTAHDISPDWHVKMQAAFQKYTDNAVSKTVNFPTQSTREDVAHVYKLAFKHRCKGVTIYRHGSRDEQVLNLGAPKEGEQPSPRVPRPRQPLTRGVTEKIRIGCGNLYVTVNADNKGICEVFTNLGRAGGCPSQSEATSRLISLALRSGVDVSAIIEQLRGIRCLSTVARKGREGLTVLSCPDAIGRALVRSQIQMETESPQPPPVESNEPLTAATTEACPDCGSNVEFDGGCMVCTSCGYSKCG